MGFGQEKKEGGKDRVRQSRHSDSLSPSSFGPSPANRGGRADICTPLPLPLIFRGKEVGKKEEIKKEGEANHIKLRFGSNNDHTTHLKGALAVCLLSRIMILIRKAVTRTSLEIFLRSACYLT